MKIDECWNKYAVENKNIEKGLLRELIADSWKRSRELRVDPYFHGIASVSGTELEERRKNCENMLIAALPHLHKLYRIISKSRTTITITDEDGVILESFYNDELKKMKNFPVPGTIHAEKYSGTNGIGTALATGMPVQIIGFEHWIKDNHNWFCNTVPIRRHNRILGVLNLSCPIDQGHEHSLGMVSSTAYAIEREMEMNSVLKERKQLMSVQKAIIELLDTGIIVVDENCTVTENNEKAHQILGSNKDWSGHNLKEIIDCSHDFNATFTDRQELDNFEIAVKIGGRHSYIGFSTAFIENAGVTEGMVLRLREPASIRHFAAIAGGSSAIYSFDDILGNSPELEEPLKLARLAGKNSTNVLITGESGTGKELIAQSIHNSSDRRKMPFVALNCGALSRELIQSELFGYEGGSFTGAKKNGNPGKFEIADGGTLFLDEIGEMPLDAQTNLLRVLQTGNVLRIGAKHPNRVDVRIIAATNKNLEDEIKNKNFRNDLYYRLNVLQVSLPPLRTRKSDIALLADHFLDRFSSENGNRIVGFTPDALSAMLDYTWPGNIRELENTIERAVVICSGDRICLQDLPLTVTKPTAVDLPPKAEEVQAPGRLTDIEYDYIVGLLKRHRGNLRAASNEMGAARSTLYNKLKKYNLDIEDYR